MAKVKKINLALQGGGAHGAFTWGALERIADDERIEVDGITATSAGSMNACCFAYGHMEGGNQGAKSVLLEFWKKVSAAGDLYNPVRRAPEGSWPWSLTNSAVYAAFETVTRVLSPYQLDNPLFEFNPLQDLLADTVDFAKLRRCTQTNLFVSATSVRTGKVRIFPTDEISLEVVMASACLPYLYKAVEIDGEAFWDGGYSGNPAIFPLFYHCSSRDVVIVHINPVVREETPKTADAINNRLNEISFNASLLKELRAVAFVHKLLDEQWLKPEYRDRVKDMMIHSIRADEPLQDLSVASKLYTDWEFLNDLRQRGYEETDRWLDQHFDDLNQRSSVDVRAEFLDLGSDHIG